MRVTSDGSDGSDGSCCDSVSDDVSVVCVDGCVDVCADGCVAVCVASAGLGRRRAVYDVDASLGALVA